MWCIASVLFDGPRKRHAIAGRAVGNLQISDVHRGEVVRPEEINDINEYNPDIAKRRVRRLFGATIEILKRGGSHSRPQGDS